MIKPPEEGRIWEWRAFGRVSDSLAARVRAYPIRLGISDLRGEDIYLVAPNNDQNVKLRRYSSGWVLKFKFLFETKPGPFEHYDESAEFTYRFPVPQATLKDAARLLGVTLPEAVFQTASFDEERFVNALVESSPAITQTRVSKKRSQYQFEGGWLELADVEFARQRVESVSIHSPQLRVVKEALKRLQPDDEMEAMNYIEACRRWG